MILPTIRASFGRGDALRLVELLGEGDEDLRLGALARLDADGVDTLLDDPRILNALLTSRDVKARPALVFYVLIRQALLEGGLDSIATADYVTSVVFGFLRSGRTHRVSGETGEEYRYLVDIVGKLSNSTPHEAFLLRAHLGAFSLWLSGLFPDFIQARVHRRGAPPIRYYEELGAAGYSMASGTPEARTLGVDAVFSEVARHFAGVRVALNRVSDRYLVPSRGDPVDRLLRQVTATAP